MEQALISQEPTYRLHRRLGFRLSRLSKLMQNRLESRLAEHGITRLKWCVLSGVGLECVATPSDLADHIGITRPAISRLLLQMRKEKLVLQSLDETDGRSRQIDLTELGQEKLRLCRPLVEENERHFMDKLGVRDGDALNRLLGRLLEGETAHLEQF